MKARSNYGKRPQREEILGQDLHKTVRRLVLVLLLFGLPLPTEAWAQDAMSDRYSAIRAPTEALIGRIDRNRLQADINALRREQVRVQGRRRQTEYLRLQDPASGFAAAERALDGRLDRLGTELRDTRARLGSATRANPGETPSAPISVLNVDTDIARLGLGIVDFDEDTMDRAITDARAFVEDLLRANRARP